MRTPELFVNYVQDETRASPINLAAMRVILGIYVLWRGVSIDAQALVEWPAFLYTANRLLYPPEGFEWILIAEKYLLLFAALAFIIGYRTRVSAFVTGILLAHLTGVKMLLNTSGETQQMAIGAMFILLFGLYAEHDKLSVDGIRRTRNRSLDEMNDFLKNPISDEYRMAPLRLSLLSLGLLYAGAAYIKIRSSGLFTWTSPESLARWTTYYRDLLGFDFFAGEVLVNSSLLLQLSTWGTLVLEFSLLVFIITGFSITPIIILLLGMHAMIAATMGVFFFDIFIFLIIFAAYDRAHTKLASQREIDLVYDEHCYFCTRSLYLFKILDTNQTINYYSQYDCPEKLKNEKEVEFDEEIYVFVNNEPHGGYYAFHQLCKQFPATAPLSWFMAIPPVATVGEYIYEYIAENRDRHFVCSYEPNSE